MNLMKILIVDDEALFRNMLKQFLEKNGYACELAVDAEEALRKVMDTEYHLLLCDIRMPGVSGLDLIQQVRKEHPDTAVIMVTAIDDPHEAETALRAGVYGYILKPFEPNQILISVANALRRRELELAEKAGKEHLKQAVQERTQELETMIKQLKKTEHDLRSSEERYRNLFDQSPDVVYISSKTGELLDINQAGEALFGMPKTALMEMNIKDLYVHPSRREELTREIERQGFVKGYDVALVRKDGTVLHCQITTNVLRDENGEVAGYRGILRDVSEMKRVEEALRTAQRENEQLFSAISSILIRISRDFSVLRWNGKASDILGLSAEAVLGRSLWDCPVRWDLESIRAGIHECGEHHRTVRMEDLRFERLDGKAGFLGIVINPVYDEEEALIGYLIMGNDITRRRQLEVQLAQAQKLESIGQLAAGIAHEINTPTQYVGDNTRFLEDSFKGLWKVLDCYDALLEAVRDEEDTEEAVRAVEQAIEEADLAYLSQEVPTALEQTLEGVERVTRIVRSMKEFSLPGTRQMTPMDLNKSLENTITVARNEWKYVAEVETEFDPSLPQVPCLPGELNQVFLNLIINAAHAIADVVDKACEAKGKIRIATKHAGDWAEIRISDTGTGIPEAVRNRVFDPFFTTKEVGKGTGQGLAISQSVVMDKHGGTIHFETEEGHGTTFLVRLPLVQKSPEEEGHEKAAALCG